MIAVCEICVVPICRFFNHFAQRWALVFFFKKIHATERITIEDIKPVNMMLFEVIMVRTVVSKDVALFVQSDVVVVCYGLHYCAVTFSLEYLYSLGNVDVYPARAMDAPFKQNIVI